MKEKLTNNWVLKVLALFLAILLWLGVVNMTDPVIVKTITNIPIEIRNEQVLTDQGITYRLDTTGTVNVNVRQTQWDQVTAADFVLYVDLEELYSNTNTLPVHMKVNGSTIKEESCTLKTTVVKIETDTLEKLRLPVELELAGQLQEGYNVVESSVTPSVITVEGPSTMLGKLERAVVRVDVSGQSSAVDTEGAIVLYDKNGDVVSASKEKLSITAEKAKVHLEILKSSIVPVVLGDISGHAAEGYRFSETQQTIQNLEIFGRKSVLSQITSIRIDSPKLSVEGATEDVVLEFDLKEYLPADVQLLAEEETKLVVTLKVEKLEQRQYTLSGSDIALIGMKEGMDYAISPDTSAVVTVEGLKDDLDRLGKEALKAQLNVAGLGLGSHEVRLSVSVESAFRIRETSKVTVIISEKTGGASSEEEGETASGTSSGRRP